MSTPNDRDAILLAEAGRAANGLADKLDRDSYTGWDPYDGLTSGWLQSIAGAPLIRRLVLQTVRRSPLNLRPLIGVRPRRHTKALALCVSALSRLAAVLGDDSYRHRAATLAEELAQRSVPGRDGRGWAYDFDVQTRWGYYRAGEPNAIVTVFAAEALLDAIEILKAPELREALQPVPAFARTLAVETGGEAFFAYYAGSRVPIHNANVLMAGLLLRLDTDGELARHAFGYTLARQRPDGSWPYGDSPGLEWVDGFHTAYVLYALDAFVRRDGTGGEALARGLSLYIERLVDPDGAPRASLNSRFPIDVHAAASAVTTLRRLRGVDPRAAPTADRVLRWTLANLRRRDGGFAYQRRRLYLNSVPYVRWSDAHMLLALATYLQSGDDD